MAVSVTGKNYTQISSCDTTTSGGSWSVGAADTEQRKEGAASLCGALKNLGNNDATFTPTAPVDLSGVKHLRMWFLGNQGAMLNTLAAGGVQLGLSSDAGVTYGYYYVCGKDVYPGGWYNLVVDVSRAVDAGTKPTSMNAINRIQLRVNLTAAVKNATNTWWDNLCVCDGLVASGDFDSGALVLDVSASAGTFTRGSGSFVTDGFRIGMRIITSGFTNPGNNATKVLSNVATLVLTVSDNTGLVNESGGGDERARGFFDLSDIYAVDDATTMGIGILRRIGGQYFAAGSFEVGAAAGTSETKFQAKSSVLVFEDRKVNAALYAFNVVDNGTGTTMFMFGSKSGSSGIEGCMVRTQSASQAAKFAVDAATDADVNNFKLYGTTFYDAGTISLPPSGADVEVLNCNFEACGSVVASTAKVQYCNFVSSDAAAVKIASTSFQVTDCNFVSCSRGVEITAYYAVYTFNALKFSGCTYDVLNSSGTALEVGKSNGSNPTTYDPGGSAVTFTGSVQLTMTVKTEGGTPIVGALAYIDDNDQTPYIMNTTTNDQGVATTGYTGAPVSNARWRVRKYGYKNYKMLLDIAGDNIGLPVTLAVDPQQT